MKKHGNQNIVGKEAIQKRDERPSILTGLAPVDLPIRKGMHKYPLVMTGLLLCPAIQFRYCWVAWITHDNSMCSTIFDLRQLTGIIG